MKTWISISLLVGMGIFPACHSKALNRIVPTLNSSANETCVHYSVYPDTWMANGGIGYDSARNQFFIAMWDGPNNKAFLLKTDSQMNHLATYYVPSGMANIQSVTYDYDHDRLWVWGWTDMATLNETILYCLNMEGQLIQTYHFPSIENSPGQIAYAGKNQIWVKNNGQTPARLYDVTTMTLLKSVDTKIAGEGIAVHGDNILVNSGYEIDEINLKTNQRTVINLPNPTGESEGLVYDGPGNLWVSVDNGWHQQIPGGNEVWEIIF